MYPGQKKTIPFTNLKAQLEKQTFLMETKNIPSECSCIDRYEANLKCLIPELRTHPKHKNTNAKTNSDSDTHDVYNPLARQSAIFNIREDHDGRNSWSDGAWPDCAAEPKDRSSKSVSSTGEHRSRRY